jgi:peptide/nickel transport system permease protein
MIALLCRRLAGLILTLITVSFLIFAVMDLLPGDPASIMLGTSASPDTLAALRQELGLDQPLPVRYLSWVAGVISGDLGQSYTYGVPVAGLIAERLAVTMPLAFLAIFLSVAIALPLGTFAAARRNGTIDLIATLFSQMSIAVPAFWVALLLIILFSTTLGLMPAGGFPGWENGIGSAVLALVMPAIALALPQAGVLTRVTRAAVLETLNEDFTLLGLQFTFLVAGAVLVENVFNLPGLGRLAVQALAQRDIIVMQDVVLLFTGLVVVMNFIVDMSYLWIDPRLRKAV